MSSQMLALLSCVVLLTAWPSPASAESDYNIEVNSFKPMPDFPTDWIDWNTLHVKKVSRRKIVISGDVHVKRNLADMQMFVLQLYQIDASSKQRGAPVFMVVKPFCQLIRQYENIYENMVKYSNLPPQHECPFPKGDYTFNDFVFEINFLPDNAKGDYLVVCTIKNGDKGISSFESEINVS